MKPIGFKHIALCFFVFTIPFELYSPLAEGSSLLAISGIIYVSSTAFERWRDFNIRPLLIFFIPLYLLYFHLLIMSLFFSEPNSSTSPFNYEFTKGVIIFSLVAIDLMGNRRLQRWSLISYVISMALLSFLVLQGMGTTAFFARVSILGYNPNQLGDMNAFAIVCVLSIWSTDKELYGAKRYLLFLLIPLFLAVIGVTGSRASLVGVVAAAIVFGLLVGRSFKTKIYAMVMTLAVGFTALTFMADSEVMKRFDLAKDDELGGRLDIWSATMDRYWAHPIFGVGETGYVTTNRDPRLQENIGLVTDTHNMFLYILICGGALGLLLFLWFLFNVMRCSWIFFRQTHNIAPVMFVCIVVLHMSKAGGAINDIPMWLFLAYIVGTGSSMIDWNLKRIVSN
jgi:O-antigen ligase